MVHSNKPVGCAFSCEIVPKGIAQELMSDPIRVVSNASNQSYASMLLGIHKSETFEGENITINITILILFTIVFNRLSYPAIVYEIRSVDICEDVFRVD